MRKFARSVASWLSVDSEEGVTAVEYGLIAALVAVTIIVALTLLGTNLQGLFNYIAGKVVAPKS
ncbi:MAG TPA: Flp family type IVb pilin [Methylocella sp.]|nr:Flp family type IVb pilin [Methylocella sp.]